MAILSFQSRVVCGGVGHAVAAFALRRLGCEVWPIDTVVLSNHPGHGTWRGGARTAAELAALLDGLTLLGVLPQCQGVLSGYLGTAGNGEVVLDAVRRVKAARPDAPWCCDPVMGDRESGRYVTDAVMGFFREHAAGADILTPNHFELEVLAGEPLPTLPSVLAASAALCRRGPRLLLASGVTTPEQPADVLATLLATLDGAWIVETPRLPLAAKGAGDLLAALFLGHLLQRADPVAALRDAVAATWAVIAETLRCGRQELALTAAQHVLVSPPAAIRARRLR